MTPGKELTDMPNELLLGIAEQCDFSSLKNLRLQCKNLAACVTPFIFQEVYFALLEPCLDKLENISQEPHLRSHVKKLIFLTDMLPEYRSIDHYARNIEHRSWPMSGSLPRHRLSRIDLENSFTEYLRHYHFQSRWAWLQSTSLSRFKLAFGRFTRLEDVSLTRSDSHDGFQSIWTALRNRIQQDPWSWTLNGHVDEPNMGNTQFSTLLEALRYSPTSNTISSLRVQFRPPMFNSPWFNDFDSKQHVDCGPPFGKLIPEMQNLRAIFRHLRECSASRIDWFRRNSLSIMMLLQDADALQDLSFRFDVDTLDDEGHSGDLENLNFFKHLLDTRTTFPNLHTLELEGFKASEATCIEFLGQHATKLRHLKLRHLQLLKGGGDWESVLYKLPRTLNLASIELDGLGDTRRRHENHWPLIWKDCLSCCKFGKAVIEYALHGDDGRALPSISDPIWSSGNGGRGCCLLHAVLFTDVNSDEDEEDDDDDEVGGDGAHTYEQLAMIIEEEDLVVMGTDMV